MNRASEGLVHAASRETREGGGGRGEETSEGQAPAQAPDVRPPEIEPPAVPCQERLARAALTWAADPGDDVLGKLLQRHGPLVLHDALRAGTRLAGVSESRWKTLSARVHRQRAEEELTALVSRGGRFICPGDKEWPGQLDDLGVRGPIGLWVRGRCSLRFTALRSVALVGARACTSYGAHVAARLAAEFGEAGWSVVSGAAYGVDGAAHRGALSAGGLTVGVLACGVDRAYPRSNSDLIQSIAEQGLLVAELPPGAHPTRGRFIMRNRVIAALTRGTIVVEAQLRSGSLVTARRASALGRAVMGVPGPVTSQLSAGVHRLLREEAELVTNAAEAIELLGDMGELAPRPGGPVVPRDLLHPRNRDLLERMPARTALTAASLAHQTTMAEEDVRARLLELSALGFVHRRGDYWQLLRPCDDHSKR